MTESFYPPALFDKEPYFVNVYIANISILYTSNMV